MSSEKRSPITEEEYSRYLKSMEELEQLISEAKKTYEQVEKARKKYIVAAQKYEKHKARRFPVLWAGKKQIGNRALKSFKS